MKRPMRKQPQRLYRVFVGVLICSSAALIALYGATSVHVTPLRIHFNISNDNFSLEDTYFMSNVCTALIHDVDDAQRFEAAIDTELVNALSNEWYTSSRCSALTRGYVTQRELLDEEERNTSIAFAIDMYKDVWQFERLLRAIYRPHHWYCVHVDLKSEEQVYNAVKRIASCFKNVIVTESRVPVDWGTIGLVDAELQCMRELLTQDKRWRYFINLTGQEFPLKTMWQLVRILNALNGSNSMEGSVRAIQDDRREQAKAFTQKYNITAVKGAVHIVVVRSFVQYVLESRVAVELREHLQDAPFPEETFFATLNHNENLRAPGGYVGVAETDPIVYPFINRLKHWYPAPCSGYYLRSVCVWGVNDLPLMTSPARRELFANKLLYDYQHYALDCLEQWYWNETLTELRHGRSSFDVTYYSELTMSHHHIPE